MSNQQWNSGQGSNEWAPQQPAREWGQESAQDWGQAQPQTSAQEWGQAQPQTSGQEWGQQAPAQDWNQAQPWGQAQPQAPGQDWNQQQGWQGQQLPVAPQQFQQPVAPKGSPFDFSFKMLSLPGAAGLIFTLGVIAIGIEWLFSFIYLLTSGSEFYFARLPAILNSLFGGLAGALFKILVLRVLIEIGIVGSRLLKKAEEEPEPNAEETAEEA